MSQSVIKNIPSAVYEFDAAMCCACHIETVFFFATVKSDVAGRNNRSTVFKIRVRLPAHGITELMILLRGIYEIVHSVYFTNR